MAYTIRSSLFPVNYLLALSDGCGRMDGMNNWINIEERLPEDGVEVLTWCPDVDFAINVCVNGKWAEDRRDFWEDKITGISRTPTYWMPLPEPPIVQQAIPTSPPA